MSAFPFQNFRSRKNSKTTYQAIHEIFLLPWMEPSMWGSGNTFRAWLCDNCVPRVKIPSSPYTTDEKNIYTGKKNEQIWKLSLALGQRGSRGQPWGGGSPARFCGESFGGFLLSMDALPFTAWKLISHVVSQLSLNLCGRASATSILQMMKLRLVEAKLASSRGRGVWVGAEIKPGVMPAHAHFLSIILGQVASSLWTPSRPLPDPPAAPFRSSLCQRNP